MLIFMVIFIGINHNYKYVSPSEEEPVVVNDAVPTPGETREYEKLHE